MEPLVFRKHQMKELLKISNLLTAHYFHNLHGYLTPDHVHEDAWEFVFCAQGRVRSFQGGKEHILKDRQIIFHPPRTVHHLQVEHEPTTMLVLSFVCTSEVMKLLQDQILHVSQSRQDMLTVIIRELANAFELQDGHLELMDFHSNENPVLGAEQMITCYLEGFLIGLLRDVTNQKENRWDAVTLERSLENKLSSDIKEYVENHIFERITLAQLSEHVHYSRSYISKQFQKSTGMTVAGYIAQERMKQARQMLLEGKMTVTQISEALGFSTVQYFSKCFRDAEGMSPSAFEKKHSGAGT